jgi:putative flippase GtrA
MNAGTTRLVRWLKFNAVGAIGVVVQLAVLTILKSGLGANYLVATAVAVETAVLHNFFWHERFTWADRKSRARVKRLTKFNLTNGAISIFGNLAFMKMFVGGLGMNYFLANLLSIAICSLMNFLISDAFVFSQAAERPSPGATVERGARFPRPADRHREP